MPPRISQGVEPPRKRVTLDEPHRRAQTFTSAQEIQVTLRKQNQDLIDGTNLTLLLYYTNAV
jgi:hypothetical protein